MASFFANASNLNIYGGEFNTINGNVRQEYHLQQNNLYDSFNNYNGYSNRPSPPPRSPPRGPPNRHIGFAPYADNSRPSPAPSPGYSTWSAHGRRSSAPMRDNYDEDDEGYDDGRPGFSRDGYPSRRRDDADSAPYDPWRANHSGANMPFTRGGSSGFDNFFPRRGQGRADTRDRDSTRDDFDRWQDADEQPQPKKKGKQRQDSQSRTQRASPNASGSGANFEEMLRDPSVHVEINDAHCAPGVVPVVNYRVEEVDAFEEGVALS
ncbi:hypothetical protein MKEN_00703000 [Mycena kentingensis (nom. inval.)]|nr:hypothetical protein MKEN_00703000 [Mycena kentingensis (nom. inval.)]